MDDTTSGPLAETPAEKAYFEQGGATPLPEDPAPPVQTTPAADPAQEDTNKQVPFGALKEERQKRQEAQAENRQLSERMESLLTGFNRFMERLAPQQQAPAIPSLEENPIGHFHARMEQAEKALKAYEEKDKQREQGGQQQQALANLVQSYQADANNFTARTPDFPQAYQHLMRTRAEQYAEAGFTQGEVQAIMAREEQEIVSRAFRAGVSPAERMYALARKSGYAPQSKTNLSAQNNASRSLSSIAGTETGELTLEKLATMSDEDFDKNWDQVMRQGRR